MHYPIANAWGKMISNEEIGRPLMQQTNRQLLVALLSAFCLLWLSAFNSVQASTALSNQQNYDFHFDNSRLSEFNCPDSGSSSLIDHHAKIEHQSCSSVCVMKMPLDPVNYSLQLAPSAIAPIGHDIIGEEISRVQTLFRPPIHPNLIDSIRA